MIDWRRPDGGTTCKRGHAWKRETVYVSPSGTRSCVLCRRENSSARNARIPDLNRGGHLRRNYDITVEEYQSLLDSQHGVCALCGSPPGRARLSVDHDHVTMLVRGLLCWHCNHHVIGRRRDADVFCRAADYLDNPPAIAIIGERYAPKRKPKRRKPKATEGTT